MQENDFGETLFSESIMKKRKPNMTASEQSKIKDALKDFKIPRKRKYESSDASDSGEDDISDFHHPGVRKRRQKDLNR